LKDKLRDQKIKKARAIRVVSDRESFDCHRLKTLIGRAPFCDVQLSDHHVSVLHAQISYDFNGSIWIKDLGSSNGVFVNDELILVSEININDKIQIGSFSFRVEDSGSFVDLQKIRENTTLELELSEVQRKLKIDKQKSVQTPIKGTEEPGSLKYFENSDEFFKRLEDESWRQHFVKFTDNYIDLKTYKPHVVQNIFHEEEQKESLILENKSGHSIEVTCTSADVIHSIDYMDLDLKKIKVGGFENKDTIHVPTLETEKSEPLLVKKGNRWAIAKECERDALFVKGENLSKDTFLLSEDSLIRVRKDHVDIFIRLAQRAPDLDRSSDKDGVLLQSVIGSIVCTLILFFSLRNVNYIKEEKKQKKVVAVVYKKPKQVQKAKVESKAKQKNAAPQKAAPPKRIKPRKKVAKKTPKRKVQKRAKPKFKLKFARKKGGLFQKRSFDNTADKAPTRKKSFSFSSSKDVTLAGGGRNPSSVSFGSGGTNKLDLNSESVEGVRDLNFTIGRNGRVVKSKLNSRSKFSASGKNCMIRVLQKIQFPKPKGGGIVDIRQPLNFSSSNLASGLLI